MHLVWLVAVAVLALLFLWSQWRRRRRFERLSAPALRGLIMPRASSGRRIVKFLLLATGLVLLIIGYANPRFGTRTETVQRTGVDVIVAFDVSRSMLATDVAPSRLIRARQFVSDLIDGLRNDRIGLIVFAGNAYTQMPLTIDDHAARMYLNTFTPDLVPTQGTAIGEAIDLAVRSFDQQERKHKALVIVTDGEDHDADATQAALDRANEAGVTIFTVGAGTPGGSPIPVDQRGTFKRDAQGEIILSRLDEDMLRDIARRGDGSYFDLAGSDTDEALRSELAAMEAKTFDETVYTDFSDQFQAVLIAALVFLCIDWFTDFRRTVWLDRWISSD